MVRITLDLSEKIYKDLNNLAEDMETTKAELLRRSLALMKLLQKEKKEGGKVLINSKGKIKEIITI